MWWVCFFFFSHLLFSKSRLNFEHDFFLSKHGKELPKVLAKKWKFDRIRFHDNWANSTYWWQVCDVTDSSKTANKWTLRWDCFLSTMSTSWTFHLEKNFGILRNVIIHFLAREFDWEESQRAISHLAQRKDWKPEEQQAVFLAVPTVTKST